MSRKIKRKKKERIERKPRIKEKVADVLELPKEVILNVPRITMIGTSNLVIENYKGIIEYDDNKIRINSGSGIIKICGERLYIKEITSEDIMVLGDIRLLEYLK